MDSAFAWIGQLMEWLGAFVPRLKIIRRTHAGVKFVGGSKVVELKPGLHFYWPFTTEVEVMPVVRQTHNLVTQTLTTKDDKTVIVGAVVIYEINDVVSAKSENWDIDDTVSDVTQLAVVKIVGTWNLTDLRAELTDKVENELSIETRRQLKPFGVKVIRCGISDFAPCRVIRVINDAEAVRMPTAARP
jgi:regulator of protease activity HflC (stomatin/prohibitin superfamily)